MRIELEFENGVTGITNESDFKFQSENDFKFQSEGDLVENLIKVKKGNKPITVYSREDEKTYEFEGKELKSIKFIL
ncbi:hypothetical protein MUA23_05520 [Mammaliicoccus sciuri]|uniref:hypothetical protein n=1 Tax=Mammaliicoccus sciuri TaxID=1296 RepID=UPI0021D2C387|nr:hypothetical protein [Mammaliicoccus sciuri]UXU72936.1 hypothetical protein MUA23_05520 [Mammaliicoccus sciuri]